MMRSSNVVLQEPGELTRLGAKISLPANQARFFAATAVATADPPDTGSSSSSSGGSTPPPR
jgi:hypothetical protein